MGQVAGGGLDPSDQTHAHTHKRDDDDDDAHYLATNNKQHINSTCAPLPLLLSSVNVSKMSVLLERTLNGATEVVGNVIVIALLPMLLLKMLQYCCRCCCCNTRLVTMMAPLLLHVGRGANIVAIVVMACWSCHGNTGSMLPLLSFRELL